MVQLVGGFDGMQPVPALMPDQLLERDLPVRLQHDRPLGPGCHCGRVVVICTPSSRPARRQPSAPGSSSVPTSKAPSVRPWPSPAGHGPWCSNWLRISRTLSPRMG